MNQIEYGDYYKFIASSGIALLVAAALLPWFFLHEPFDLTIEASKIVLLTPEAQTTIHERQHLVAMVISVIPYASPALASLGAFMTIFGLVKWHQRQEVRDTSEDLGVEKLRKELQQMSPAEVEEKARKEVEAEGTEEQVPQLIAQPKTTVSAYLAVEGTVLNRIQECYGSAAKCNQKLAGVEYDAIIRTGKSERIILEIRYIRKGFHQGWLNESVSSLQARTALYSNSLSHPARGVLLIVIAEGSDEKLIKVTERMQHYRQFSRLEDVRIRTVNESLIKTLPCHELQKLLS